MRMNVRSRTTPPPTHGVRVSACRALAVVACAAVALVVSLLNPVNAYASDYQDVWNHQSIDGGQQYIVGAYNAYDAAAFVCGYSSSTVSGWDLPTLAKLSNAPAIVALADGFGNVTPWNDDLLRDTCEQYFGTDLWNKMQSMYGGVGGIHVNAGGLNPVQLKYWQDNMPSGMHVYALNTTSEAVGAAKEAFRAILSGEGTPGTPAPDMDGYTVIYATAENYGAVSSGSTKYHGYIAGGDLYCTSWSPTYADVTPNDVPSSAPVYVKNDTWNAINAYAQDGMRVILNIPSNNISSIGSIVNSNISSTFYIVPSSACTLYEQDVRSGTQYAYHIGDAYMSVDAGVTYGTLSCTLVSQIMNGSFCFVQSNNSTRVSSNTKTSDYYISLRGAVSTSGTTLSSAHGGYLSFGSTVPPSGGGGDDPEPPNNWPDDDTNTTVAPTPPDLPTPKDPTIPTEPDPDPPYYYTPPTPDPPTPDPPYEPTEPTGTSPTDYTPWLRAILNALGGISANMATHCQHLQAQMKAQATRIIQGINNQLVNLGTSINGAIKDWAKWLGECLGEGLNTLTDNLYDLFHWLAEQFDFTYSGDPYDDSGIIGWLRRIYNRLGNGGDPKHYAPTILDPGSEGEEEPFDFWAWLLERIASILGGVLGGATDAVSTLLEGIRGKFPFSIPWDLLAFLGMLSGERAIPVFTFTIPAVQGWWGEIPIRVDLTPYDSAATACRTMVLIWWAFILAMKSTWMINDVLGALGSSIVSRFTGRLVGTAS